MMQIYNIKGTSDLDCRCGSWIAHWEKFARQSRPSYCPVDGCLEKEVVGAHVQKNSQSDRDWYIYPLCDRHNQAARSLLVADGYPLIPANRKNTCEK